MEALTNGWTDRTLAVCRPSPHIRRPTFAQPARPAIKTSTMASPALQSQANALNARMEGEAKTAIDSIERELLRPLAQKSYECIAKSYRTAGTNGSNEQLEHCSRSCQVVHQQAHGLLQQVSGCTVVW